MTQDTLVLVPEEPNLSDELAALNQHINEDNESMELQANLHMDPTESDPLLLANSKMSETELARLQSQGSKGRALVAFYRRQNELIDSFLTPPDHVEEGEEARLVKLKIAVWGSLAANVFLFALQLVAAIISGSLSLLATTADAFMDLTSSTVLVIASQAAAKSSSFVFPAGGTRFETAGIIVFSTLMSTLSIQLIIESIRRLSTNDSEVSLSITSIILVACSIFVKFSLYLYCSSVSQYPTARILAQDHRNDIAFNSLGIIFSVLGSKTAWWVDPTGAMIIALLVMRSWISTGKEHIQQIVGKTASPELLQRLTYIALTHDERVMQVDTVRAYHSGPKLFVEIDIVLPPTMALKEAHDIGEALQFKLESMPIVDRAFVHVDYESDHKPEH